jgi:DtxR family Mn-dependent transcriptional regulator
VPDGTSERRRRARTQGRTLGRVSGDLIDTTEMYLKTIYELVEEGIVPLRARIAERLGHSGPTVSQTVARMERDGLVVVSGDRHLELTEDGMATATRVMRKHRLAERLLTDVIGLEWSLVHDEACRWEHVMSERVEQRILELLDHPRRSPYGNPIPGLDELGEHVPSAEFLDGVVALPAFVRELEASGHSEGTAVVARLGEPVQVEPDLLCELRSAGVLPDTAVVVRPAGHVVTVGAPDAEAVIDLPDDLARHIFVVAGQQPAVGAVL